MGIEHRSFELIKIHDGFEIRRYSDSIQAIVSMPEKGNRGASESFMRIAAYIFGSNDLSMKIPMTSPVHQWSTKGKSRMAFIIPREYQIDDLPIPNDDGIELAEVPGGYAAVLRFSGFSGARKTSKCTLMLKKLIAETGYKKVSDPILAVYDNPSTTLPFLRRNEIIIPIQWTPEG